ncbi:glycine receptor subunit alpha-2-like isoform X2 [Babylonia areolata]|uniref:glycine receptor subunit alpha-2-like isoform X2 n=1 Tax=Babylonia areolata TaxID=304850 RepID=UPI003FD2D973
MPPTTKATSQVCPQSPPPKSSLQTVNWERIIKGLLNDEKYDNRIPPNYEDNFPTNVTIQVFILSFDSVKEASMVTYESGDSRNLPYSASGSDSSSPGHQPSRFDYSVTIFLREHWQDKRLRWGCDFSTQFSRCHNYNNYNSSNNSSNSRNHNNNNNFDNSNGDENVFSGDYSDVTPATDENNNDVTPSDDVDGDDDDQRKEEEEEEEVLEWLEVDSKLLDMVWLPDLYFLNEKEAVLHDVTTANRMLHIYRNGSIRTSSRISMTLSCDMHLERYPHDEQTCSMFLGSYSYSAENVLFHWHEQPVLMREGVTLPRFQVHLTHTGPCGFHYGEGSMIYGNYTCIRADFHLTREFGYYIAQVYVPSCMIVALSWVSFWIDLEAIPARVSLGLLTVLTMTTQSTGEKAALPRVSYLKAIDVWMAGCLVFVFGALLEFAYVNVQSRVEKRRRGESLYLPHHHHHHQNQNQQSRGDGLASSDSGPKLETEFGNGGGGGGGGGSSSSGGSSGGGGVRNGTSHSHSLGHGHGHGQGHGHASCCEAEFKPVEDKEMEPTIITKQHSWIRTRTASLRQRAAKERARTADKFSRVIFPFTFLLFNIIYWMVFVAAPL